MFHDPSDEILLPPLPCISFASDDTRKNDTTKICIFTILIFVSPPISHTNEAKIIFFFFDVEEEMNKNTKNIFQILTDIERLILSLEL